VAFSPKSLHRSDFETARKGEGDAGAASSQAE